MTEKLKKQAIKNIPVAELELNIGQIDSVPRNPRFIKDERYAALKKSIENDPEMLDYRTLLVYPLAGGHYVILCGNMRYLAAKELGFREMPCYVLPADTPKEKLRAYIVKDNIAFGQNDWDMLANEWELDELQDFGIECNFLDPDLLEDPLARVSELSDDTYEKPEISLLECPYCHHIDSASRFKKAKGNIPVECADGGKTTPTQEKSDENIS